MYSAKVTRASAKMLHEASITSTAPISLRPIGTFAVSIRATNNWNIASINTVGHLYAIAHSYFSIQLSFTAFITLHINRKPDRVADIIISLMAALLWKSLINDMMITYSPSSSSQTFFGGREEHVRVSLRAFNLQLRRNSRQSTSKSNPPKWKKRCCISGSQRIIWRTISICSANYAALTGPLASLF